MSWPDSDSCAACLQCKDVHRDGHIQDVCARNEANASDLDRLRAPIHTIGGQIHTIVGGRKSTQSVWHAVQTAKSQRKAVRTQSANGVGGVFTITGGACAEGGRHEAMPSLLQGKRVVQNRLNPVVGSRWECPSNALPTVPAPARVVTDVVCAFKRLALA